MFRFTIQDLYTATEVKEPRGWPSIESVLRRDFQAHGMFFNFTSGALKLGFVGEGKDLLELAYQTDGVDAFYQFIAEEREDELQEWFEIFRGQMDFSTRRTDLDFFEIEINNSTNELKIKNRKRRRIGVDAKQNLDGDNRSGALYFEKIRSLATKPLREMDVSNSGESPDNFQSSVVSGGPTVYIGLGVDINNKELEKVKASNTFFTEESQPEQAFIEFEEDGWIEITYDADIDIAITEDAGSGTTSYNGTLSLKTDIPILEAGNPTTQFILDTNSVSSASPYSPNLTWSIASTQRRFEVRAGTKMWLNFFVIMGTTGNGQMTLDMDINSINISMIDKIATFPTESRWYSLHEAINKNLDFLTGQSDFLYSDLLGAQKIGYDVDGCLHNLFVTNGYRVRQVNDDGKSPVQSFQDLIKGLNAIRPVGYGIEDVVSDKIVGYFDIFWDDYPGSGIVNIEIPGANLTYDIFVGDFISFYNSETLFGKYEVTVVAYNAGNNQTTINFDASDNDDWYTGGLSILHYPTLNQWFYDVMITVDNIVEEREKLRIEDWTHFYTTNLLLDLGTVEEYEEEPFEDALFNGVLLGYRKYANDEEKPTTFEEIHGEAEFSLPTENAEDNLDLKSPWIGSGFMLNESRDRIFSERPTTSHKLDV